MQRIEFLTKTPRRIMETTTTDGRRLKLRSLNERERAEYEAYNWRRGKEGLELDEKRTHTKHLKLIQLCVVDEDTPDQPLLKPEDIDQLEELDGGMILDLAQQCRDHAFPARPTPTPPKAA